jgi:membrane-associated PAP2 superfamily phosphatase
VVLCLVSSRVAALRPWRHVLAYMVVAAASGALLVGLLKNTTNVDCPRATDLFGGTRPYVDLLANRPDDLPRGRCFPGGHSASGFALFVLYFGLRDKHRQAARGLLALALATGGVFAFAQEARGEHFISHDIWSAALLWFTSLGIYAGWLARSGNPVPGKSRGTAPACPARLPGPGTRCRAPG